MPKTSHFELDAAAWDVFARHQPYYHILCHPMMLNPDEKAKAEFWAGGERKRTSKKRPPKRPP